jgi:hypothetical protein
MIDQRPYADGESWLVAEVATKVIGLSAVHDVPQRCCDSNSTNRITFGLPTIAFHVLFIALGFGSSDPVFMAVYDMEWSPRVPALGLLANRDAESIRISFGTYTVCALSGRDRRVGSILKPVFVEQYGKSSGSSRQPKLTGLWMLQQRDPTSHDKGKKMFDRITIARGRAQVWARARSFSLLSLDEISRLNGVELLYLWASGACFRLTFFLFHG